MSQDKKPTPDEIFVEMTVEKGLDAAKEHEAAQLAEKAKAEREGRDKARLDKKFKKHTLLVAEDDPDLQEALALEAEDRGFHVVRASDGVEAVRKAHSQHFDAILIDMNLPKKMGHEAVGEIRSSGPCRKSVIVVLSGYLKKEVVEFLAGKIEKAFTKPADIENVMQSLSALLEKKDVKKTG